MKKFSKIEINVIKSVAKNAAQFVTKKQKLEAQIKEVEEKVAEQIKKRVEEKVAKLQSEVDSYQSIIDGLNAPVKQITGGYTTEDLVIISKEGTGQMDKKTGKEIMKTVCILRYPDTVIPSDTTAAPTTENVAGSDFDIDKENANRAPEETPEELIAADAEAAAADPFNEWN